MQLQIKVNRRFGTRCWVTLYVHCPLTVFQASLSSVSSNEQSSSASQSNSNMVMIISPPVGPPIVIPLGRRRDLEVTMM